MPGKRVELDNVVQTNSNDIDQKKSTSLLCKFDVVADSKK